MLVVNAINLSVMRDCLLFRSPAIEYFHFIGARKKLSLIHTPLPKAIWLKVPFLFLRHFRGEDIEIALFQPCDHSIQAQDPKKIGSM